MVSIQNGRFVPLYFKDILDPVTKKTKVRMVDPSSESFYIARRYMLRLSKADFEDPYELAKYAVTCGITLDDFRKQFFYLIENDLLYKNLAEGKIPLAAMDSTENSKPKLQRVPKSEDENGNGIVM